MPADEKIGLEGEDSENSDVEMSFLDHLEELRWRLIYALIGVVLGAIAAWIFIDPLVEYVLLKPARDAGAELQNLRPFGQLFLFIQVAIIVGVVVSLPNLFYQLWKFISPALKKKRKKIYSFDCNFFITLFFSRNSVCIFRDASISFKVCGAIWN